MLIVWRQRMRGVVLLGCVVISATLFKERAKSASASASQSPVVASPSPLPQPDPISYSALVAPAPPSTAPEELSAEKAKVYDPQSCEWKTFGLFAFNRHGLNLELESEGGHLNDMKTKFNFYGNWCGPHYPAAGKHPRAIDELDAVCMRHDLCYAKKGYLSCACDQGLLNSLGRMHTARRDFLRCKKDGKWTTIPNAAYAYILLYFKTSPCKGGCKAFEGVETCDSTSAKGTKVKP